MKKMRCLWALPLLLLACGKTTYATLNIPASQPISPDQACGTPPCPVVMVDGQQSAYALAIDANNIYWTTLVGGTIMQAPITTEVGGTGSSSGSGSTAPITLATGQVSPFSIAVNFQAVYWASEAPAGQTTPVVGAEGTITGVIIGNTAQTVVASKLAFPVFSIAASVALVFWPATNGGLSAVAGEGGKTLFVANGLKNPGSVAVDAKFVYVATTGSTVATDVSIEKIPYTYSTGNLKITTPTVKLVTGQPKCSALIVDFNNAYWITPGAIMKIALDGSAVTPTTLASGGAPFALAVDATNIYWTDPVAGTINSVPIAGGNPVVIASGQDTPIGIAADATNVYWTTSGAVMRQALAK